jgi:S-adenosylhomocysteine hydrolase
MVGMCTAMTLAANGARVVIAEVDSVKADEAVKTLNDPSGPGAAAGPR